MDSVNPWQDSRFLQHYVWLLENLKPTEVRVWCKAHRLLTTYVETTLVAKETAHGPYPHNEYLIITLGSGRRASFKTFLKVLKELGPDFKKKSLEIGSLFFPDEVDGEPAASESPQEGGSAAAAGTQSNTLTPGGSYQIADIQDKMKFYREVKKLLTYSEMDRFAEEVIRRMGLKTEMYRDLIEGYMRDNNMSPIDHRNLEAIFRFWMAEPKQKPSTEDILACVAEANQSKVEEWRDVFKSFTPK